MVGSDEHKDLWTGVGAPQATPGDSQSGFAQVLALAGLALVGGLLTLAVTQAHQSNVSFSLHARQIDADIVASSAVRRLLAALDDPADDLEQEVGVHSRPYPLRMFGEDLSLTLEGEAGKIDVATANLDIIKRYIELSGVQPDDWPALLRALVEARAAGDGPVAMEALYLYLIPVGAGEQVDQDFTMRSGLTGVDPALANARVLRALPDLSESTVEEILDAQEAGGPVVSSASRYFATGRPLFTVVATVHWGKSERFTKRVPIEITTGGAALVLSGFR